jgi:hypothetical protein
MNVGVMKIKKSLSYDFIIYIRIKKGESQGKNVTLEL